MTGRVKWYSSERGFGFIAVDDGRSEVFIHATTLQRLWIASLSEGQRVTLEVSEGRKGARGGQDRRFRLIAVTSQPIDLGQRSRHGLVTVCGEATGQ